MRRMPQAARRPSGGRAVVHRHPDARRSARLRPRAARARQIKPDIKLLYTSGYALAKAIGKSMPIEEARMVNKPYRLEELITEIRPPSRRRRASTRHRHCERSEAIHAVLRAETPKEVARRTQRRHGGHGDDLPLRKDMPHSGWSCRAARGIRLDHLEL